MSKKAPKPRMGRPPKPEGEARTTMFTIRVNAAEREAIAMAATTTGKRDTEWARDVLLERARS